MVHLEFRAVRPGRAQICADPGEIQCHIWRRREPGGDVAAKKAEHEAEFFHQSFSGVDAGSDIMPAQPDRLIRNASEIVTTDLEIFFNSTADSSGVW